MAAQGGGYTYSAHPLAGIYPELAKPGAVQEIFYPSDQLLQRVAATITQGKSTFRQAYGGSATPDTYKSTRLPQGPAFEGFNTSGSPINVDIQTGAKFLGTIKMIKAVTDLLNGQAVTLGDRRAGAFQPSPDASISYFAARIEEFQGVPQSDPRRFMLPSMANWAAAWPRWGIPIGAVRLRTPGTQTSWTQAFSAGYSKAMRHALQDGLVENEGAFRANMRYARTIGDVDPNVHTDDAMMNLDALRYERLRAPKAPSKVLGGKMAYLAGVLYGQTAYQGGGDQQQQLEWAVQAAADARVDTRIKGKARLVKDLTGGKGRPNPDGSANYAYTPGASPQQNFPNAYNADLSCNDNWQSAFRGPALAFGNTKKVHRVDGVRSTAHTTYGCQSTGALNPNNAKKAARRNYERYFEAAAKENMQNSRAPQTRAAMQQQYNAALADAIINDPASVMVDAQGNARFRPAYQRGVIGAAQADGEAQFAGAVSWGGDDDKVASRASKGSAALAKFGMTAQGGGYGQSGQRLATLADIQGGAPQSLRALYRPNRPQ